MVKNSGSQTRLKRVSSSNGETTNSQNHPAGLHLQCGADVAVKIELLTSFQNSLDISAWAVDLTRAFHPAVGRRHWNGKKNVTTTRYVCNSSWLTVDGWAGIKVPNITAKWTVSQDVSPFVYQKESIPV